MRLNVTYKTTGEILETIRKYKKLTLESFTDKMNKSAFWEHSKENDKHKIYIADFRKLAKLFDFNICFIHKEKKRQLYLLDYDPNDLMKYIREITEKNQTIFAKSINKGRDWIASIETGRNKYYANDLFELACKNDFEIILEYN